MLPITSDKQTSRIGIGSIHIASGSWLNMTGFQFSNITTEVCIEDARGQPQALSVVFLIFSKEGTSHLSFCGERLL